MTRALSQLASYLITLVVVAIPAAGAWFLTESIPLTALVFLEVAALLVVVRARTGLTPGGFAMGTRVARREDHLAPGLRREAVRSGVLGAAHVTVIGGILLALSGLFDPQHRHRAWQDRIARTRILPSRQIARDAERRGGAEQVRATLAPVPADRIDLGREITRLGEDPRHGSGARGV
ncbi:hypothetical protein CZ771_06725 [Actinomycetales bacterium JB111]|nr:hypothetical protein CZ771_06725 [Actinomycetales bacterium JB111]